MPKGRDPAAASAVYHQLRRATAVEEGEQSRLPCPHHRDALLALARSIPEMDSQT